MRALTIFTLRTLAGYLAAAGQFYPAIRLLDWTVRRWPEQAEAWALRGQILLRWASGPRAGRAMPQLLEAAADAYGRAEELQPDLLEPRRERGLSLLRLAWLSAKAEGGRDPRNLLETAIGEYERVLRAQPRRADVHHERAMARAALRTWVPAAQGLGLLEAALADLDESVRLRPHAGEAIFHRAEVASELARLYHAKGRWRDEQRLRRQSVEDHRRVRQMRPDWTLPLVLQAVELTALAKLGDDAGERLRQAIDDASTVLAREPRNAQAALVRADARLAAACRFGDADDQRARLVWNQAEADFQSAVAMVGLRNREEVKAAFAQGQAAWAEVLQRTGEPGEALVLWKEALDGLERAVDDDPRDPTRLLARAGVLVQLATHAPDHAAEWRQQALADIEGVLESDPESPWALALRALARLGEGGRDEALLADVRQARRLAPEDERILAAERRVLLQLAPAEGGDTRAAILHQVLENCAEALRLRADDARAHLDQARALHLAGRAQAAYRALEQALRLAPALRHEVRQDPVWADVAHGDGFKRLVGAD